MPMPIYAMPLLLEVALQLRNVQREEVRSIAGVWNRLKGCLVARTRVSKGSVSTALLKRAVPELFEKGFPRKGPLV